MREDVLPLLQLSVHELVELEQLVDRRRGEVIDADHLVFDARRADLTRVEAVALEGDDDGESLGLQHRQIPRETRRSRSPADTTILDRVDLVHPRVRFPANV